MVVFHRTLASPEENLAGDEALALWCEQTGQESLRFWEAPQYFVVLGYGNAIERETFRAGCAAQNVPILRRISGGGTVVQGPGCLSYALALRVPEEGPLLSIPGANRFILQRHARALTQWLQRPVTVAGETDLVLEGRKFSGNAQRRFRHSLLFHGTFLLNFDLACLADWLPLPRRQPAYRQGRAHGDFLTNLHRPAEALERLLAQAWEAIPLDSAPQGRDFLDWWEESARQLARDKYACRDWNEKRLPRQLVLCFRILLK